MNELRNIEQLKQYIDQKKVPAFHFFYNGIYSQWWRAPFTVDGIVYNTAEHWMMVKKAETFGDNVTKEKILKVAHPNDAKILGRQVANFDPKKWSDVDFEFVVQGNVHKFTQNPKILEQLKIDYPQILVEASPTDKIWGIGLGMNDKNIYDVSTWKGTNKLGFAIMEARTRIFTKK